MSTLRINAELLRQAEQQARLQNISLDQMVEGFIRRFVNNSDSKSAEKIKVTPFIERLGVDLNLPADFNEKEAYRKHLEEKYQ